MTTVAAIILYGSAIADEYRNKINEGFDYYESGAYDKAAEKYKDAAIVKPEQALPNLYEGAALYKMNDFQGAADEFERSIVKDDPKLKADSYFNAGNAYLKDQQYDKAVQSYIDALKIKSKDKDYKHNLELALQQQQMQQQQKQDQGDKGDKGDKNQQEQNQQNQQSQDEQEKDQQQPAEDQEKKDQQPKPQQAQRQEDKMSEEQAKELLSRFEDDEKETQKRLKQVMMKGSDANDW
jgi:Ca-activated chloride channel family protein